MLVIGAEQTRASLRFDRLIPALRDAFIAGAEAPLRHRHDLPQPDGTTASLLLMPAWRPGSFIGTKLVTVFPGNAARAIPAVSSSYLLCDGQTGRHLALIDGTEITGRRTAAASALAADYLARPDAATLLIVGSGHVAGLMADAHAAVRPIRHVRIWNIRPAGAERLAAALRQRGIDAEPRTDLQQACAEADIITCATLSRAPLIHGDWLQPGCHLDLIGAFTPFMRETDDECIRRARVFIDTDAALAEAGDLLQPIQAGLFRPQDIVADLARLCRGDHPGRQSPDGQSPDGQSPDGQSPDGQSPHEITLFKSVGSALEDLAAAALAYEDAAKPSP